MKKTKSLSDKLKSLTNNGIRAKIKNAKSWFTDKIKGKKKGNSWFFSIIKKGGADKSSRDKFTFHSLPRIGFMYFYIYDPKWKKVLKYYDTFPLVIPIGYTDNGFLGLNFHYLPNLLRAKLLDELLKLKSKTIDRGKNEDYIKISYQLLQSLKGTPYQPTIKRYLWSHVRSNFVQVDFDEWEIVVFLPVEQFKKADKREVWKDSRAMVKNS